jgi:hypothetical protein
MAGVLQRMRVGEKSLGLCGGLVGLGTDLSPSLRMIRLFRCAVCVTGFIERLE